MLLWSWNKLSDGEKELRLRIRRCRPEEMLIKRITIFDKEHYTELHRPKRAISMRVNNERSHGKTFPEQRIHFESIFHIVGEKREKKPVEQSCERKNFSHSEKSQKELHQNGRNFRDTREHFCFQIKKFQERTKSANKNNEWTFTMRHEHIWSRVFADGIL